VRGAAIRLLSACECFARRIWRATGGGTAVIFAIVAPGLLLVGVGAVDLAQVNADRTAMQDAADATALAMAKQLGVATASGISARATDYADQQLGQIVQTDSVAVTASIASDNSSVTVTVTGHRGSFFGSLLPPGGWNLRASATAATLGQLPLCVLSHGIGGAYDLHLKAQSRLTAGQCLTQSNGDIVVDAGARLATGMAQAAGTANGPIVPSPQTGAPTIADPFTSLNVSIPANSCSSSTNVNYSGTSNVLAPGIHCGNITVQNNAVLQLAPGEHYFAQGHLTIQGTGSLTGDDVVAIFDKDSDFTFADSSTVTLGGRQSGTYAGFVIATTRQNDHTFKVSSTSARKLEGAIYVPAATLDVEGTANTVAQQSAWTVIVARAIQMDGSANLVVNSNYATSSVPVPAGVGSNYVNTSVALRR